MSSYNHFSYVPSSVTDDRSAFKFSKPIAKGINLGWLYPICKPITMLPGSTLSLDIAMEIRSQPLIAPLMSEMQLDLFAFNVPNRIVWEHWKQFLGAVDDVLFDNLTEYSIPHFRYGCGYYESGAGSYAHAPLGFNDYMWNQTLACHFELPRPTMYVSDEADTPDDRTFMEISALPFRGYDFIVNEFFIPEYLSNRCLFSKTDDGYTGDNMCPYINDTPWDHFTLKTTPYPTTSALNVITYGGVIYPVMRAHRSLYTSCLPKPSLETLNLLGTVTAAPVVAPFLAAGGSVSSGVIGNVVNQTAINSTTGGAELRFLDPNNTTYSGNIYADISQALLTVNNYRETILLQNYLDALNRSGSRYDEILANLFHTRTSMAIIDVPELIVHKRFTIYRKDVVSTAQTNNGASNVKPLGSQAGYIDTVIRDNFFTKSTTEHGYIHLLMCVRPANIIMTSGFEPDWTVLNKLDLFYEQFQGMGDVPRRKSEVVYGFGTTDSKTDVLGYQEYSAEYKWQRGSAVGWLDPHATSPLKGYVISDILDHTADLELSYFWLSCFQEEVSFANCLAVPDPYSGPQFICDIRLDGTIYHPMKVYNIPGMGDAL